MYWENKPNSSMPNYIKLCINTVKKHCSNSFNIKLLNEKNIYKYLPNVRKDLDEKLNIQPKTDVFRFNLLYKYGGIWLDTDTIVFKDLIPIIHKLRKFDFVGFGCHKKMGIKNGKPNPSIWALASRPNTPFIKDIIIQQNNIINNHNKKYFDRNYFRLGRILVWDVINKHMKNNWNYYHWNSDEIERDKNGYKLTNKRLLSNEKINIQNNLFTPIYNTAPGFPKWFKVLNKTKLLKCNMLISKLFKKALSK